MKIFKHIKRDKIGFHPKNARIVLLFETIVQVE